MGKTDLISPTQPIRANHHKPMDLKKIQIKIIYFTAYLYKQTDILLGIFI